MSDKRELYQFLGDLNDKYLPDEFRVKYSVSTHFMDRLLIDRKDSLSKGWVATVFSIIYQTRLCEFLYLFEIAKDRERVNIHYKERTIALVFHGDGYFEKNVKLTTCFSGVALNPTIDYHVLSLDNEAKKTL